ncbi:MAG: hypothetical protein KKB70_08545 [Proteobacteria bacterium]|nr:hypothetical protein [Pseudomonadota bacterium]
MGTKKDSQNETPANMKLWNSVAQTDPGRTEPLIDGAFKGTAINPLYVIQKATYHFGPMGIRWGAKELEHVIQEGIWSTKVQLWYEHSLIEEGRDGIATIEQWGGAKLQTQLSNGGFVPNEDAAKMAFTSGLKKCLTYLGFCADVYLGFFDNPEYVKELWAKKAQIQNEKKQAAAPVQQDIPVQPKKVAAPAPQPAPVPREQVAPPAPLIVTNELPQLHGIDYDAYIGLDGQEYVRTIGTVQSPQADKLRSCGFTHNRDNGFWCRLKDVEAA